MASPTQWTWVWASFGCWWRTGSPGLLKSMGSQRVGHDWATELNWNVLRFFKRKKHNREMSWAIIQQQLWPLILNGKIPWKTQIPKTQSSTSSFGRDHDDNEGTPELPCTHRRTDCTTTKSENPTERHAVAQGLLQTKTYLAMAVLHFLWLPLKAQPGNSRQNCPLSSLPLRDLIAYFTSWCLKVWLLI